MWSDTLLVLNPWEATCVQIETAHTKKMDDQKIKVHISILEAYRRMIRRLFERFYVF